MSTTVRLLFCILIVATCNVYAQPSPQRHAYLLYGQNAPAALSFSPGRAGEEAKAIALVQLRHGAHQADLVKAGYTVKRVLSDRWFVVQGSSSIIEQDVSLIEQHHPVNHLWKINEALVANLPRYDTFTIAYDECAGVQQRLSSDVDINVIVSNARYAVVSCRSDILLERIVPISCVRYVGRESRTPREESRVLDLYLAPNKVNTIHSGYPSLNGAGLVLSVKELSFNPDDIDLKGRTLPSSVSASEISNHATDMATLAAGGGNSFITGLGPAYGASIISASFENLAPEPTEFFQNNDVSVQNHSYGTVVENFYGTLARQYDEVAREVPTTLQIFSSGNRGQSVANGSVYAGTAGAATLTGNFKQAKNILVVGAADTASRVLSFASRGPAYDGRIKPELVAYSSIGTSNAAALVSGISLILQQAYREREGSLPTSDALKAILVNSAEDVGRPGIDFESGYGNVNAAAALKIVQEGHYVMSSVSPGGTFTLDLNIPANTRSLKVTVVWNDAAAVENAGKALVNDLDLEVSSGSNTWLPWILNTSPSEIQQPATRGTDRLNNIEHVSLENVEGGVYTISIIGHDLPAGPQAFALVYQWDLNDQFEWFFPRQGDNVPYNGETATYFYWKSTHDGFGVLEWTTDDGLTWNPIAENVDLAEGRFRWAAVPFISTTARARMRVGNEAFETEPFVISRPTRMSVGFDCADSVMIRWQKNTAALRYHVYNEDSPYSNKVYTTTDTFFIFQKNDFQGSRFAIQPELTNGLVLRSPMTDYSALGTECFILSFNDVLTPEGILLNLQLGTVYGVERVFLEREITTGFQVIDEYGAPDTEFLSFLDASPAQGYNRYRIRLALVNGEETSSEILENFFVSAVPFFVFPNPVRQLDEVRIFSRYEDSFEMVFNLFKSDGTHVLMQELFSDREFIMLEGLTPGLYLYTLTSTSNRYSGKLVILPE